MDKPYPVRLKKSPIIEAIVEIRFQTLLPKQVVFGLLYAQLNDLYPRVEALPIMEIPETIRENDPNFINAPHYRIKNDSALDILIGPTVVTISYNKQSSSQDYPGWTRYIAPKLDEIYTRIQRAKVVNHVTRLGIRYMDFFESINVFDKIEFSATLGNNTLGSGEMMIRANVQDGQINHTIAIMNKAMMQISDGAIEGSLIDIDTFKDFTEEQNFFDEHATLVQECHISNKERFFEMLKDDFVQSLDPEFEGN